MAHAPDPAAPTPSETNPSPETPTPAAPPATARRPLWQSKPVVLTLIVALLSFVAAEGAMLLEEWARLRAEQSRARASAIVGYPGIQPAFSFAQRPVNWVRRDGEATLLWAGWEDGVGHNWFRAEASDVDVARLTLGLGRDVHRAIDRPVVETGGGPLWDRVPDEALVAGGEVGGVAVAYPLLVLDKVAVVNDEVAGRPVLVVYDPDAPGPDQVAVYEPVVGGRRVTMGSSGLLLDRRRVMYDRGTESLWAPTGEGLTAVTGRHRGVTLRRLSRPSSMTWSEWRSGHPGGRLVVGADRTASRPEL